MVIVVCKKQLMLHSYPAGSSGCAHKETPPQSVLWGIPHYTGSMLGILYTFWGMGFLIFM